MSEVTLTQAEFGVQLQVADSTAIRMAKLDTFRDTAMRSMIYGLTAYVAQNRQWEEEKVISRKLTWRERIRALFGSEIETILSVSVYRNCPHLQTTPQSDHLRYLVPHGPDSA